MKFTIPKLSLTYPKDRSICISKSIRDLNVIVFWEIIRTGDFTLLDKNHFQGKRYLADQEQQLSDAWMVLCDEYFIAKDDSRSKVHLKNSNEQRLLQFKIKSYNECISTLNQIVPLINLVDKTTLATLVNKVYDVLVGLEGKSKIVHSKTIQDNLKVAERVLSALINKYNIAYSKVKKNLNEDMFDGFELVASIEEVLNRPLGDLSKISVAQFVAYEKQVNKKVLTNKKRK